MDGEESFSMFSACFRFEIQMFCMISDFEFRDFSLLSLVFARRRLLRILGGRQS